MSYKTFSIDDFSGGLNTAVAQSRLDVRFSPDLQNVDFTDTGAITRRKGYTQVTPTAFSNPVKALHRFYQSDGDRFWVMVSGTGVYTIGLNTGTISNEVPVTTLEGEDATFTAGNTSEFTFSKYSAGAAMRVLSGSATFTIPSRCTNLDLTHNCSALLGASFSLDGGAYVGATTINTSWDTTSLSGGDPSHTVKVKPAPRNDKSMKLWVRTTANPSGNNPTMPPNKIALMRSVDIRLKTVSIRFYDSGETTQPISGFRAGVAFIPEGAAESWLNGYAIYRENTVYKYRTITGQTNTISGITPSVGWHTITLRYGGKLTLDGVDVVTVPNRLDETLTVACFIETTDNTATQSDAITYYFDTLKLDDVIVDDIEVVNATPGNYPDDEWQLISADTTDDTSERGASLSDAMPDVDAWFALDKIVYSALSAWEAGTVTLSASSEHFGFSTLNDIVYFNSPYDELMKFDGSSVSVVSGTQPRGGFLIEHKRRLWTAGDYADTSMLSYSDVDEPEDWIGGGDIRLAGKDSGGRCTGIAPFDNKVFYFSDSRIYSIDPTGPDTNWSASMAGYNAISWSLGCIAPKSLIQTDNALIFLSADGVRAYGYIPGMYSQDGSGLIDLSENIRPTLDTIDPAMRGKAAGAFYNGRYYLACALGEGATSNNTILVYNLPTQGKPGAWTKYVGTDTNPLSVTCFAVTRGDEYGLFAGTNSGTIIRLDIGMSDNGEDIAMVYKTPQLAPKGFETIKHFSTLHLAGESQAEQSLDVHVDTDDVEIGDVSAMFGSGTAAQPVRLPISSRGRSIQYTLTGSGQAQPLTISRLTTQYLAERVR